MTRPRILSISFSPIHTDARVLRQLAVLASLGDVTTIGYGPHPEGAAAHHQIPDHLASLPATMSGVLRLALNRHRSLPLTAPAERAARELLADSRFDLVVANDARALPLAFDVAGATPVWADMHEWAPEENSTHVAWRLLVKPYMDALCAMYLPRAAAVTTVGNAIAKLYVERYGVTPEVVRNAGPYRELAPSAVTPGRVRLVHSGVVVRERNIEGLIEAVERLGPRFSLDLYLMGDGPYRESIAAAAARVPGVTVHPPTTPDELPGTLNGYDLGVYILPLRTVNHRLMLPNKFFDFVQARIGIVMSPAEETSALIAEHGLGPTLASDTVDELVRVLGELTADDLSRYKRHAHQAATRLNSAEDVVTMRSITERLLRPGSASAPA